MYFWDRLSNANEFRQKLKHVCNTIIDRKCIIFYSIDAIFTQIHFGQNFTHHNKTKYNFSVRGSSWEAKETTIKYQVASNKLTLHFFNSFDAKSWQEWGATADLTQQVKSYSIISRCFLWNGMFGYKKEGIHKMERTKKWLHIINFWII